MAIRTMSEMLGDFRSRLTIVERRLAIRGGALTPAAIPILPFNKIDVQPLTTQDLDTITTQGLYECASVVNGLLSRHYPLEGCAGIVEVIGETTHVMQRMTMRNGGTINERVFVRVSFAGGAFGEWHELATPGLTPGIPYKKASGMVTLHSGSVITTGSSVSVNVTFPVTFDVIPNIIIGVSSSRLGAQVDTRSTSGFRFLAGNFSGASAGQGAGDPTNTFYGWWEATQMKESAASG